MTDPGDRLIGRRAILAGAGSLVGLAAGARGQSPFGQPGIACTEFDAGGVQTCTTGIPSNEMAMVYAPRELFYQHQSQWCWAASLEMIFRYHNLPISQERIVHETFGELINMPAQPQVILQNVNRVWKFPGGAARVSSDFATVSPDLAAWELLAKRPLIVGTLGHAMVMSALTYRRHFSGQGQPVGVVVRDPWPGRGRRSLSLQEIFGINQGICFRVRVS